MISSGVTIFQHKEVIQLNRIDAAIDYLRQAAFRLRCPSIASEYRPTCSNFYYRHWLRSMQQPFLSFCGITVGAGSFMNCELEQTMPLYYLHILPPTLSAEHLSLALLARSSTSRLPSSRNISLPPPW